MLMMMMKKIVKRRVESIKDLIIISLYMIGIRVIIVRYLLMYILLSQVVVTYLCVYNVKLELHYIYCVFYTIISPIIGIFLLFFINPSNEYLLKFLTANITYYSFLFCFNSCTKFVGKLHMFAGQLAFNFSDNLLLMISIKVGTLNDIVLFFTFVTTIVFLILSLIFCFIEITDEFEDVRENLKYLLIFFLFLEFLSLNYFCIFKILINISTGS